MRRVLLVCLLLMLPFQGAWAVVADIVAVDAPCAAAQQVALHGEHGGEAHDPAGLHDAMADCDGNLPAEPCCDGSCSSCSVCHGQGLVALIGMPVVAGSTGTGGGVPARSARRAPDHVPDQPLRPPLLHQA